MDVLITKLDTTNLGNEILSAEMVGLARERGFLVLGRPLDLHRYRIGRLPADLLGAVATFSAWADTLTAVFGVVKILPGPMKTEGSQPVVRTRGEAQVVRRRSVAHRVWTRVAERLPMGPRYLARMRTLRRARSVVYSGAGEVSDFDPFLRQALELEMLLRFGVRVHAVNHSVVSESPRMDAILAHIYRRFTSVVVRGERSRRKLIGLGVDAARITIAPDTAWRVRRVEVVKSPGLRVGITVSGFSADADAWADVVRGLQSRGAEVVFLTSDPGYDLKVGRELATRTGLRMAEQAPNAEAYRRELGQLDLVVSERLHTAVMAAVQGVPIIPIERGVHKTAEVFEYFGEGVEVVVPNEGWQRRVLDLAEAILASPERRRARILARVAELADAARRNVPDDPREKPATMAMGGLGASFVRPRKGKGIPAMPPSS